MLRYDNAVGLTYLVIKQPSLRTIPLNLNHQVHCFPYRLNVVGRWCKHLLNSLINASLRNNLILLTKLYQSPINYSRTAS